MACSPLACRILLVMPSGPAALCDGKRFIVSLISSWVGALLRSRSEKSESKGCGILRVCVARSPSDSSQGERGWFDHVISGIYDNDCF